MKLSYKWLQSYFDEKLPNPEDLGKLLTMQLCEIEGIEKIGDDTQIDAKELPDRACYLLGHKFFADEIGALLKLKPKANSVEGLPTEKEIKESRETLGTTMNFQLECPDGCRRNVTRVVSNVTPKESPVWLKERLITTGQRPINFLVDITNFVAYEVGEAMHAFDKDKITGQLRVRYATDGEKIKTLDGKDVILSSEMMVIADDRGPLDIAGIKGGNDSAVSDTTTSVLLLAANYDKTMIRKTAQKVGIRNDSSKRFENGVTPERAMMAIELASALIAKELPEAKFAPIEDVYPNPAELRTIDVDPKAVRSLLGLEISDEEIQSILNRSGLTPIKADSWTFNIPPHRLDITDNVDISEEVGRIYGYDKLPAVPLPRVENVAVNKTFSISNKIRTFLQKKGFSEVYTHTLVSGSKELLANPLNADRGTLRDNLSAGLSENIQLNIRHKDYLGVKEVKIFEIGHVYEPTEHTTLAFGIGIAKNEKIQNQKPALESLAKELAIELGLVEIETHITFVDFICEINLESLLAEIADINKEILVESKKETVYEPLSPFPYSIRDVAVFVGGEATEAKAVLDVITAHAGQYLHRVFLFDVFTKKGSDGKDGGDSKSAEMKTSYGYRMIFQSKEKTLSEEEIAVAVTQVTNALKAQSGWEVR